MGIMPSGDTLSVVLFFIGLAASFYIQTLNPEIRKVRMLMWITAAILLLIGMVWLFLGVLLPTFAISGFATSVASFASSPLTWFTLLMVSLIASSLIPALERGRVNPISPSPVVTELPQLSSQDTANREKIAVLFRGCAQFASSELQEITNRILDQLNTREDEKDKALAELVRNTVHLSCNRTHHAMLRVLKDQNQGIPELQRHLEEFVLAYRNLGKWMIKLLMVCDLEADAEHEIWHGKHEKFNDELRRLLALDDFSTSRERLGTSW